MSLTKRLFIGPLTTGLAMLCSAGAHGQTLPLGATVTQDEGLLKHLYSFELPPGRQQFIGLTGAVSFSTTQNAFGEALMSVNYYQGPDCAAINGTSYASYNSPGFPPLTHLAAFILKSPRAGTFGQQAHIHLSQGVQVASCIVLVLDGGGAWGPGHGNGYTVTMTSDLALDYAPIAPGADGPSFAYAVGGELEFGPYATPSGSAQAKIVRLNPQAATAFAVDAFYGSVSASAFDGSSGEAVPSGYWGARVATIYYPGAACQADFPVAAPFNGPLHVFQVPVTTEAPPPGGLAISTQSLPGTGAEASQTGFFQPTTPLTLQPGDCLLTLYRVSTNGVIDLENQSTAIMRPIGG
jgi:hypothetical protein